MAVAVQRDLVAGRGDLGGQRRAALDLLADEEEGRPRRPARAPQHGGRSLRCGPSSKVSAIARGRRAARDPRRDGGAGRGGGCRPGASARPASGEQPVGRSPRAHSRFDREHERGGRRERGKRRGREPEPSARESARELAGVSGDLRDPEAPERLVVRPDVPATPAVGDRRAAAHVRLEHRQPARRVDERVAGREPVGHPSVKPSTRTRGSPPKSRASAPRSSSFRPHRQTTGRRPDRERRLDGAGEVADSPAAARDEHDLALRRQARAAFRASRRRAARRTPAR